MKPVIFIMGPSASGKTALAFSLAPRLGAAVINADSLQVYQGMNIGTAKPDLKNFPDTPCYLFDHVCPPKLYTAGLFEKEALLILKKTLNEKPAFVVGGSGFYLNALEKGSYKAPPVSEKIKSTLTKEAREKGLETLYQRLKQKDPEYLVHPHDRYRIIRALAYIEGENKKMSDVKKNFKARPFPYPLYKIGLKTKAESLKKKAKDRIEEMLQKGLIKEVEGLKNQGLSSFPPLQSVGYRETLLYLEGKIKKEELSQKILTRTLQLIKKQKTWLKRDQSLVWRESENQNSILEELKQFISNANAAKKPL